MIVKCDIFPRANLPPDQYKLLGKQIEEWIYDSPSYRSSVSSGIQDLHDGELPQPYYVQQLIGAEGRTRPEGIIEGPGVPSVKDLSRAERQTLRDDLGERADWRIVPVTILGAEARDRKALAAGLKSRVDAELVSDVLIEGVTWCESFDFDATLYRKEMICAHIIPREELDSEGFARLGVKVGIWWQAQFTTPENSRLLMPGLESLLACERPLRIEWQFDDPSAADFEQYEFWESELHSVFFVLRRTIYDVRQVADGLRGALPIELIDDVLINRTSWTEIGD
jgi:hypothetical protein